MHHEDDNVDEQNVSNPWSWHWLEKDINIDINQCVRMQNGLVNEFSEDLFERVF